MATLFKHSSPFVFNQIVDSYKLLRVGQGKAMVDITAFPPPFGIRYDVYLSFHGTDVGTGFVSHLVAALVRNQIEVAPPTTDQTGDDHASFFPRVDLEKIERSYVCVVVFSGSYPESERCLDELVHVAELVKAAEGQKMVALPVFYQVDPTEVQELTERYGQAIVACHEEVFRRDPDRVDRWRRALKDISNKSGRALQDTASEATLIEEIVNDIWKKLESLPAGDPDDGFVGMNSRIEEVGSLLSRREVRSVGIWGMGGIGKTALAENLYNKIAANFEGRCFVNVREELERCSLVGLRDRIISVVLNVEGLRIGTPKVLPIPIRRKLQRTRVLLVLDDVGNHQEWEVLAGRHVLYCPGSKIIVTSGDKQVLRTGCDRTYEVRRLGYRHSWSLFKRHTFEHDNLTGMHIDLARRVLKYADGIPLALKVLGSALFAKGVIEWEGMLEKLRKMPDKKITQVLRITFEELEHHEKSIFLDIACFFNDADKDRVQIFWDACGSYPTSGIRNLKDRAFIEFSKNKVRMHDWLRQMGQDIVRRECIQEPGNRSRLWDPKDVYHALSKQRVSEKIEGISLDMLKAEEMKLSPAIFSEMHNLRLLRFYILCSSDAKIHLPDGLHSLPDQLRLLHWTQYPLKYLPLNFGYSNLVELDLQNSRIEQLWGSDQCMGSLKTINLSNSHGLIRMADPSTIPNIEDLNLRGCRKLEEVPASIGQLKNLEWLTLDGCRELQEIPSSLGSLKKLNYLSLANCINLGRFPSFADMANLECLSMFFCSKLAEFPEIPLSIKKLDLSGTSIQEVPSSIGEFTRLVQLGLGYCTGLKSLPNSIGYLQNLEELYLVGCSNLSGIRGCTQNLTSLVSLRMTCQDADGLPENLGNLLSLEELIIVESAIKDMPVSVSHLSRLRDLSFWNCKSIAFSPFAALGNLSILHIMDCGISEVPDGLGSLKSLTELHLRESKLKSIPTSIKELSNLVVLKAQGCKKLQNLPELPPRLQKLDVYNCSALRSVSELCSLMKFHPDHGASEEDFTFANCFSLDEDTRQNIVGNSEQKILRFLNWMLNEEFNEMDPSEDQHPSARPFTCDITSCLPGSQVPFWFEHQTAGSSITITTERHKLLDLRRLAFCSVVRCSDPFALEVATIICDLDVYTKSSGHCLRLHSFYQSPAFLEDFGERFLRSDHVLIWYHSDFCYDQSQYYFVEASFEFYPVDWEGRRLSTCEVVSCGVSAIGRKLGDDDEEEKSEGEVEDSLLERFDISWPL